MTDTPPITPLAPDPKLPEPTQKVVEPPKTKEVEETKLKLEKEELLKKIGATLNEFGGHESDIPLNHEYWAMIGRFRGIR